MADPDGLIHILRQQTEANALAHKVEPLTFAKLPWVEGIDTLPDVEWMQSNPDGKALLAYLQHMHALFPTNITKIELFARPLRNNAKLMLSDLQCQAKACGLYYQVGMISCITALEDIASWDLSRGLDAVIQKKFGEFMERYPGAPLSVQEFLAHVRVNAEYWLAKAE